MVLFCGLMQKGASDTYPEYINHLDITSWFQVNKGSVFEKQVTSDADNCCWFPTN